MSSYPLDNFTLMLLIKYTMCGLGSSTMYSLLSNGVPLLLFPESTASLI